MDVSFKGMGLSQEPIEGSSNKSNPEAWEKGFGYVAE